MGFFDLFGKKNKEVRPTVSCGVVEDDIMNNNPVSNHMVNNNFLGNHMVSESSIMPESKYKFRYVLIDDTWLEEILYFVAPQRSKGYQLLDLGLVYGIQEEKSGVLFSFREWSTIEEEPRIKSRFIMKADNVMYDVSYRRNHYDKPTEFAYDVPEPYLELAKEAFAFWLSGDGYMKFSRECVESGLLTEDPKNANIKKRLERKDYIWEITEKWKAEQSAKKAKGKKTTETSASIKEPVEVLSFAEYGKMALEQLEKDTKLPFMSIKTVGKTIGILDSKFGGLPYLPSNESLPLDKEGKPMRLLAQINCKDLAGLEEYPQEGMLQFYLTTNPRWDESVVKYYEAVDEAVTAEMVAGRVIENYENSDCFPVEAEYGLEFTLSEESMSRDDNRLMALFCQYFTKLSGTWISVPDDGGEEVYELFEGYCDDSYAGGHKVGGYNSAAQLPDYYPYREDDTPIDVKADDSPVLLFQMDSESKKNIMWGDLGVARFFIKRSDLKARKFEKAYLVWDCS